MAKVTVDNIPGFVYDANRPPPDYIVTLTGRKVPLTSIDSAYEMANITCQTFAMTKGWQEIFALPGYRTAPDEIKNKVLACSKQLQLIQARNLLTTAMLFRTYSIRVGFQTDYMKSHNWSLQRISAPDENGDRTIYDCNDYEDWISISKNMTRDVLQSTSRKPSIVLSAGGATMNGMGVTGVELAPVVLATAEAGAATAATTGAVAAAEVAGAGVVAGGGTIATGVLTTFAWPIVGIVAVITLGAVTTYGISKGFAWWQNRDAADTKQNEKDKEELRKAVEDLKNCTTEECRRNARERIEIYNQRVNDNAAQQGGLINGLLGGTGLDLQGIAYTALGLAAVYMGLQLFLKNRPASSEA